MYTSKRSTRVRRHRCLAPEVLEGRLVLSSGQGSTFAIMPGNIATAGSISSVPFKIDPTLFTAPKSGKLLLGIDVVAVQPSAATAATSNIPTPTVKPEIVSIKDASGHIIPIQRTRYDPKIAKANHLGNQDTSAILFTVKVPASGQPPASYSVQVKGMGGSIGQYLVGFYLPGDAAGTGTVTKTDITTIKTLLGDNATNKNYNFDADVNRNGIINRADLKLAQEDLGASTKVSPVASVNLDPASDPGLDRTTDFSTVHFAGQVTPGASVTFANNSNNGATTTTTANSTGAYSIMVPLVSGSNTFTVTTQDGFGQSISGQISPVVYDPPSTTTVPGVATSTPTSTSTTSGTTTSS
ncbi:MAG TPA: dockerin type I domain-containing protein [Isosphaeraceae bacterium]|nr:dockerin type I domain-containing protein [Isosphaeraceae bacterium]